MRFISNVLRRLIALLAGRRASAAVEFALVLPVALVFYVGVAEISDGVMASRQVTTVTRTLVDLTSQQGTSSQLLSIPTPTNALSAATLSTIMAAAQTMLTPQPTTSLTMTISAIDVRNVAGGVCCVATVRWSYTQGGQLRPCGVQLTPGLLGAALSLTSLPTSLLPVGTLLPASLSFIVADVSYSYQPMLWQGISAFAPSMQRTVYMMPRTTGQVVTGTLPAAGSQTGQVCY